MKNLLKKIRLDEIFYSSCKTMPLWNYKMYLETQDKKYFSSRLRIGKKTDSALYSFFDDYFKLTENNEIIVRFSKLEKIEKLKGKYNVVMLLLQAIHNHVGGRKELLELVAELGKWGYRVNPEKELFEQLSTIKNRLEGVKTAINLINGELEKDDKKDSVTIESQLDDLENIFEKKYRMDIKDYTVFDFVMMQKKAKEIIESRKKHSRNGKPN